MHNTSTMFCILLSANALLQFTYAYSEQDNCICTARVCVQVCSPIYSFNLQFSILLLLQLSNELLSFYWEHFVFCVFNSFFLFCSFSSCTLINFDIQRKYDANSECVRSTKRCIIRIHTYASVYVYVRVKNFKFFKHTHTYLCIYN